MIFWFLCHARQLHSVIRQMWPLLSIWFSCTSHWIHALHRPTGWGTMAPPAPGAGADGKAQQQAGGVTWSSLLQYSAPMFPAYLLSGLLWLGEALITKLSLQFASNGQSVSSEKQNLCATPELNWECRRNAKGEAAIWPSGDRAAKKLQTLAFDDLLWPWPYVSYQQVSGLCGAPHIQRIPASPPMVPQRSTATITKAGAQFAPKGFTQKQCMWKKKND